MFHVGKVRICQIKNYLNCSKSICSRSWTKFSRYRFYSFRFWPPANCLRTSQFYILFALAVAQKPGQTLLTLSLPPARLSSPFSRSQFFSCRSDLLGTTSFPRSWPAPDRRRPSPAPPFTRAPPRQSTPPIPRFCDGSPPPRVTLAVARVASVAAGSRQHRLSESPVASSPVCASY